MAKKTSVLVSYSIHTDRDDVKKIFEPKAPSLIERERGLKLYHEAGIETRLSCMPILPLDPENYAERFAPYITKRVWIASMNHKQLTQNLFRQHFPEWLNEKTVETAMRQTKEAFEKRGVECFYASLEPQAKQARWEKRTAKIEARKNAKNADEDIQPSLF